MFGSGARIGLQPADEYILCISVLPVAKYYKNGIEPVQALVLEDFDRAATKGVGNVKVAGNYAPAITPTLEANKSCYSVCLYLDSKTETYVEEFATSNFIAIEKESGAYVTPESGSVLPSVTNKSLMQLAESEGRTVLQRPIKIDEVMDGKFSEIASYGTAAIVTPVHRISYKNNIAVIGNDGVGPYTRHLCDRMKAIQYGEEPDVFGWMMNVC
jgi:branched-chain amino acid aminotransferase